MARCSGCAGVRPVMARPQRTWSNVERLTEPFTGWPLLGVGAEWDAPPADVVAVLNREVNAILKLPEVVEKIASQGGEIVGGSAREFADFLPRDTAAWAKLIKEANIRLD